MVLILRKTNHLHHTIRMRNIHLHIKSEYGLENVRLFWQREKLEWKMADIKNHRRFWLRCLSDDIIPTIIRLKSNIKSPKGYNIIKRTEKVLLNERIRMVNNTITMIGNQINTCMNLLKGILDRDSMEECSTFIKTRREARHIKTQMRQVNKFNQLCHKNRGGCSCPIHGGHGRQAPKQQQMPEEAGQISPNTTITASKT